MRSGQSAQFLAVEPRTRLGHDRGDDSTAPDLIRDADDTGPGDAGQRDQHLFDLARIDLDAAGDDEDVKAIEHCQPGGAVGQGLQPPAVGGDEFARVGAEEGGPDGLAEEAIVRSAGRA